MSEEIADKDLLVEAPYFIGHTCNPTWENQSYIGILCPPGDRRVQMLGSDSWVHESCEIEDDCEGEDDGCDGYWSTPDEMVGDWLVSIPWSFMLYEVLLSKTTVLGSMNRESLVVRARRVFGLVDPPGNDVSKYELYRLPLPNTYSDGNICMGAATQKSIVGASIRDTAIDAFNNFWQSPYNFDLQNVEDLVSVMGNWESNGIDDISQFRDEDSNGGANKWTIENVMNLGAPAESADNTNKLVVDIFKPESIFNKKFSVKNRIRELVGHGLTLPEVTIEEKVHVEV